MRLLCLVVFTAMLAVTTVAAEPARYIELRDANFGRGPIIPIVWLGDADRMPPRPDWKRSRDPLASFFTHVVPLTHETYESVRTATKLECEATAAPVQQVILVTVADGVRRSSCKLSRDQACGLLSSLEDDIAANDEAASEVIFVGWFLRCPITVDTPITIP